MKTKTLRVFSRLKSSSKYTFAVLFGMILMVGGSTYAALSNGTPQNLADGEVLMSENWNAVSSGVNELDNRTAPITNSGGNIGIGRSDPMQKLDVNGSIRISEDIIHTEATPIDIRATDANGSVRVYTGNDKLGLAQASSGNVGIGTESPGAKLDVVGEGYFGSTNKLKIHENNGGLSIQGTLATDDAQKKNLFLNAWGGNVGIGTTSPSEKLEVNGNVKGDIITADQGMRVTPLANAPTACNGSTKGLFYFNDTQGILICNGANWNEFRGPQGAQGPAGAKGDKGDTGAKGDKGNTGPKGDTGDAAQNSFTLETTTKEKSQWRNVDTWDNSGPLDVTCNNGWKRTGCTASCKGREVDFDLQLITNGCRLDYNTTCDGSEPIATVEAVCMRLVNN
jgi:hypothetical protein